MKILQLRFKNLNSLAGEWLIDFTDPAFAAEGIFSITGPTGAGKSSILDAICLALYGRTPRLGRVTKSSNEIMSRQSGECFAEVTFATVAGRYRCHWSQHRSRRSPGGELQQPKQELVRADSGEVLESKLREVEEAVIELTGMDFERFTRSVLLAQGGFAAFLQATADSRAPILEQITGTDIYSRISIRTHEMQREQREQLKLLQARLGGVRLLSTEQEQELLQALEQERSSERTLVEQVTTLETSVRWQEQIRQLQLQQTQLEQGRQQLATQQQEFEPERARLALALQAAELEPDLARLQAARRALETATAAHEQEQARLPQLTETVRTAQHLLEQQATVLEQARQQQVMQAPELRRVRVLDQELRQHAEQLALAVQGRDVLVQKLAGLHQARQENDDLQQKNAQQQSGLQVFFQQNAADEWLVTGLAGVEQQLVQLEQLQNRLQDARQHEQQAQERLQALASQLEQQRVRWRQDQQAVEQATATLSNTQEQLAAVLAGRQLEDYETEQRHLWDKRELLARIESLEAQRDSLHDGKPCPLCGATRHPYAHGQVPRLDGLGEQIRAIEEQIKQVRMLQEQCRQHERRLQSLREQFAGTEKTGLELSTREAGYREQLSSLGDECQKQLQTLAAFREQIGGVLEPLGVLPGEATRSGQLLEQLRIRRDRWQQQMAQARLLQQQQQGFEAETSRLQALIGLQQDSLQQQEQQLQASQQQQEVLQQQRLALFGQRDPDAQERLLQEAAVSAEQAHQQQAQQLKEQEQLLARLQERIAGLERQCKTGQADLAVAQDRLASQLTAHGFVSEQALQEALLPAETRQHLQLRARQLDTDETALRARLDDLEDRLATEQARELTTRTMEEVQAELQLAQEQLQQLRNRMAALTHQLQENEQARAGQVQLLEQLALQQEECRRLDNLHALIGSADGKKFRNFAQGLTFELMVAHANRTLQQMSDRYLLVRDSSEPLELNVLDNYQAGEIRSTKNLSGGESFIVSLALALGLSRMASQNVRVDSLFLDEGFGTLDEEALDVALDTLAGLQQDGKLIGVISHVQALKERIATQIRVRPLNGGRSRIEGPGCSRLEETGPD
ncbi:AAA family ATPase [Thiopseudomonas denitrificans]|uniref:Exonuclease SbcC n=1 Tax=Thiopseudomonas denitrificans TaxID=1501432 RepID=A0A4R6U3L8_9GAMM|nr:AAA family ATPase [Thiopseudomonas denitrificans]TDQ39363.1 exonuclease SbcC [Thiopseudomonas denitrificans]